MWGADNTQQQLVPQYDGFLEMNIYTVSLSPRGKLNETKRMHMAGGVLDWWCLYVYKGIIFVATWCCTNLYIRRSPGPLVCYIIMMSLNYACSFYFELIRCKNKNSNAHVLLKRIWQEKYSRPSCYLTKLGIQYFITNYCLIFTFYYKKSSLNN